MHVTIVVGCFDGVFVCVCNEIVCVSNLISFCIDDIFVLHLHWWWGRSLMGHCPARGRRAHLLPLKEPPTCLLTGPCPPYTTICWTTTSILLPCRIKPATHYYMPDHADYTQLYWTMPDQADQNQCISQQSWVSHTVQQLFCAHSVMIAFASGPQERTKYPQVPFLIKKSCVAVKWGTI